MMHKMFNTALSTSLWMGDLDEDLDEQAIVSAFAQLGENVIKVRMMTNTKDGNFSRNYCFVEFHDVDCAQRALQRLNGKYIPGRPGKRFKLNPASFGRNHELLPEFSLYVGELSMNIDDYDLFAFFQKRYKSVRGAKVVLDQNGKSRGFGFIRFSDEADQQRALIEMQHMTGLGRRPIKVSLASIKRPNESTQMVPAIPGAPTSHSTYYGGHYSWGGYSYPYSQPYPQPTSSYSPDYGVSTSYHVGPQAPPSAGTAEAVEDDSEVLEDPGLEVNVGKENREFIGSSESFFAALERSRWQPLDTVTSEIPD